ncbi:membrane protein insertion efficiency factor YidD [Gordonia sp. UBA5067]|uniref:membrane protein insertion efficiency factor YidD n=1 Tax=Gordonia TaxID=2053 RepID=UPI0032E5137C
MQSRYLRGRARTAFRRLSIGGRTRRSASTGGELLRRALIAIIRFYQVWISPTRLPSCRFEPTCSAYAVQALTEHGLWYGSWLSLVRLAKCGPWHKPGFDPVPAPRNSSTSKGLETTC